MAGAEENKKPMEIVCGASENIGKYCGYLTNIRDYTCTAQPGSCDQQVIQKGKDNDTRTNSKR